MGVRIHEPIGEIFIRLFNERATQLHIALAHCLHYHCVIIMGQRATSQNVGIQLHHMLGWVVAQERGEIKL